MVGVAVKVILVPTQTVVPGLADILTDGVTVGATVTERAAVTGPLQPAADAVTVKLPVTFDTVPVVALMLAPPVML